MARHAQHVEPADRRLGLVPAPPPEDPRVDPLEEGLALLAGARTERQRLKALEQIRAATALAVRDLGEADEEQLAQIARNLDLAETAYRDAAAGAGFEVAVRALQGVREAVRQRIDHARSIEPVQVNVVIATSEGHPIGAPVSYRSSPARYFAGVPKRFHDPVRYRVHRTIALGLRPDGGREDLRVFEVATDGLVWRKESKLG